MDVCTIKKGLMFGIAKADRSGAGVGGREGVDTHERERKKKNKKVPFVLHTAQHRCVSRFGERKKIIKKKLKKKIPLRPMLFGEVNFRRGGGRVNPPGTYVCDA